MALRHIVIVKANQSTTIPSCSCCNLSSLFEKKQDIWYFWVVSFLIPVKNLSLPL